MTKSAPVSAMPRIDFELTEFDMANIQKLEALTKHSKAAIVAQALHLCNASLEYTAKGYKPGIQHDAGDMRKFSEVSIADVAQAFNARSPRAQVQKVFMGRSASTLQSIENITAKIKASCDGAAVGFALAFAAACVDKIKEVEGVSKRFRLSKTWDDRYKVRNIFDNTPRNRLDRFKRGIAQTFKKSPAA